MPEKLKPCLTPTGIGSLPHANAQAGVNLIFEQLADGIPYWPQLPKRAPTEDISLQYARALHPLIQAQPELRSLLVFSGLSREEALAGFYERLFSSDLSDFGLNEEEAAGMFVFMERIKDLPADEFPWIKGQVEGPLTLGSSVPGPDGKALFYDDEVIDALAKGLGAAGAAQVKQLAPLGRKVLMFVDEASLSSYGSAFTSITRDRAIEILSYTVEEIRSRCQATIGVHCCGNTDWSILVQAGADVISLDSFGYGEHLLLYPEAVKTLLDRGGAVAWGVVPTLDFQGNETAEGLWARLRGLLQKMEAMGIDRATLAEQSFITPACGMGTRREDEAERILELTRQVSELARAEYMRA